jgi:GNAT superfamily N-acetyltransferase
VRGRGFGTRLFDHAVMHARNRGVSTLVIYVARENEAMLSIVRRAGAQVSFDGAEATARLPLLADTLGTRLEAMLERHAAEFDYQLKLRVQARPVLGRRAFQAPATADRTRAAAPVGGWSAPAPSTGCLGAWNRQ